MPPDPQDAQTLWIPKPIGHPWLTTGRQTLWLKVTGVLWLRLDCRSPWTKTLGWSTPKETKHDTTSDGMLKVGQNVVGGLPHDPEENRSM